MISERWQAEVADTVFDTINHDCDKIEQKKKAKQKKFGADEKVCAEGERREEEREKERERRERGESAHESESWALAALSLNWERA